MFCPSYNLELTMRSSVLTSAVRVAAVLTILTAFNFTTRTGAEDIPAAVKCETEECDPNAPGCSCYNENGRFCIGTSTHYNKYCACLGET
jgi:hypothetical protein